MESWNRWSERVLRKENQSKTQVCACAKGINDVKILQEHCPDAWQKEGVAFLGVSTAARAKRRYTKQEEDRAETCNFTAIYFTPMATSL